MNEKIHVSVEVEFSASHLERFERYISTKRQSPTTTAINEVVEILKDRGVNNVYSLCYKAR